MECTTCKGNIVDSSVLSTESEKYGQKNEEGLWYCNGCLAIMDMIGDSVKKSEKMIENLGIETRNKNETVQQKEKPSSKTSCFCKKCNKMTVLNNTRCEECNTISPLFIRNKKK
jgi:hypothetical protein